MDDNRKTDNVEHTRRVVAEFKQRNVGNVSKGETTLFAYCVACSWYRDGTHGDIMLGWIKHMREVENG